MGAETANSHKLNGEGQTEVEAQEHFAYEQKQRRLANNRVSASPVRSALRRTLMGLMRVCSLTRTPTSLHCILSSATPNLLIKIPQPPSSYPVYGEQHASMAIISSQQLPAIQDAPPTSMVSDPMYQKQGLPDYIPDLFLHSPYKVRDDQNEGLPNYLADFFLHSPGKVGHVSQNALDNLEVPSQEDWACTYPKRLEEAQIESSGLSFQGAASSWSVSCSWSDIQQAASGISMSSSSHFDSHPQNMSHGPMGEKMDLYFVRPCGEIGDVWPPW
ncbi:hypothetical protein WJX82_010774 [Trebouxia sp. C0006]